MVIHTILQNDTQCNSTYTRLVFPKTLLFTVHFTLDVTGNFWSFFFLHDNEYGH